MYNNSKIFLWIMIVSTILLLIKDIEIGKSFEGIGSPHLFPGIVLVAILGLSLQMLYSVNSKNIAEAAHKKTLKIFLCHIKRWCPFIAIITYVLVIPLVGFWVATFLFVMFQIQMLSKKRFLKSILYSTAFEIVIIIIFCDIMGIQFPVGYGIFSSINEWINFLFT